MTPSVESRKQHSGHWLLGLLAFAFLLAIATIVFLLSHPANHAPAQLP